MCPALDQTKSRIRAVLSDARRSEMEFSITAVHDHARGKVYRINVDDKDIPILFTFHALQRIHKWALTDLSVLEAILSPEEVLRGHRQRFIAHRRSGEHVLRIVYEYEETMPVIVTVYFPLSGRYFEGGTTHEDQILT